MRYDLSHLTQEADQAVFGPIQDDEALFLYALCKVECVLRVIEFGGLEGYSAQNFLVAVGKKGTVYTVDPNITLSAEPYANWKLIKKEAQDVRPEDFDSRPVDLAFFDCHNAEQEMLAFSKLLGSVITNETLIVVHDTGLHPYQTVEWAKQVTGGWVHQPEERKFAEELAQAGYSCLTFSAPEPVPPLLFRHGLTVCRARWPRGQ